MTHMNVPLKTYFTVNRVLKKLGEILEPVSAEGDLERTDRIWDKLFEIEKQLRRDYDDPNAHRNQWRELDDNFPYTKTHLHLQYIYEWFSRLLTEQLFAESFESDEWTVHYLKTLREFIQTTKQYSSGIGRSPNGRGPSMHHMHSNLFQLIVCIFLSPDQIERLHRSTPGLPLDAAQAVCRSDSHGNRSRIQQTGTSWLVTAAYLVLINQSPFYDEQEQDVRDLNMHFSYRSQCAALLRFVNKEKYTQKDEKARALALDIAMHKHGKHHEGLRSLLAQLEQL